MTDNADDVFQYQYDEAPWSGTQGAFHPEIDIRRVFIIGADLYIEFDSTPQVNAIYPYTIYIDIDNDEDSDYDLLNTLAYNDFYLMRESDGLYWNITGGWSATNQKEMGSISGSNLTFVGLDDCIPTDFSIAKYAVVAGYSGDAPTLYTDYAPLDPSGGIPGFAWIFTCFGIITLLGMVFLYKREITPQ